MIPDKKICGICGVEKPKESFQIRKKPNGYTWLRLECKQCGNEKRRQKYSESDEYRKKRLATSNKYHFKNREERLLYHREHRLKNIERFREHGKIRYAKNSDEIKEKRKEYYRRNPEKHKKIVSVYSSNNKEKLLAAKRVHHKFKRETDLGYRLMKILRSRLTSVIKKGKKCLRTKELIGCSMDELRRHLENKFTEGMNWNNHGLRGWHVDHIIPCDAFDLVNPEEQRKCFHYSNLQPLWWYDNIKKSNKVA